MLGPAVEQSSRRTVRLERTSDPPYSQLGAWTGYPTTESASSSVRRMAGRRSADTGQCAADHQPIRGTVNRFERCRNGRCRPEREVDDRGSTTSRHCRSSLRPNREAAPRASRRSRIGVAEYRHMGAEREVWRPTPCEPWRSVAGYSVAHRCVTRRGRMAKLLFCNMLYTDVATPVTNLLLRW